jgi:hypothetical protein
VLKKSQKQSASVSRQCFAGKTVPGRASDWPAGAQDLFEKLEGRWLMSRGTIVRPPPDFVGPVLIAPVRNVPNESVSSEPTAKPSDAPPENLVTPGTRPLALAAEAIDTGGIRIKWSPLSLDPTGQIIVFRKEMNDDDYPKTEEGEDLAIAEVPFNATSFDDTTAVTGVRYDYRVRVYNTLGAAYYEKYILSANAGTAITNRGAVLLVVDETQLDTTRDGAGTTLAPALARYKADLIAEGYRVIQITAPRVDVPRTRPPAVDPENPTPAEIAAHSAPWFNEVMALKTQIRNTWLANPDLKSVFLLGHVAVPYSGFSSPDVTIGHEQSLGAWPADIFYSVLSTPDEIWWDYAEVGTVDAHINLPGDGKFDHDSLSQVGVDTPYANRVFADVTVGRVDFAMLDNFTGVNPSVGVKAGVGETQLLARYLDKTHEFKTGQWDIQRKALFEEAYPFGEYYDTNRLTPNVGIDNVVVGTVSPTQPAGTGFDDPFATTAYDLHNQSSMWLYTGAGGFPNRSIMQYSPQRQLRTDQYSNGVWASSSDFTRVNDFGGHKAVFNYIYASYVGDWDYRQNLLRAVIAEPEGYGLVSMWGARPVWDQHHMGLGEPISTSALKTWNNFGAKEAYTFDPNSSSTRQALLGDPTLRQDNLKPATNVQIDSWSASGTQVRWTASADAGVSGYYVYRANAVDGAYTLLNATPVAGTNFLDTTSASPDGLSYLVRATKLETTASGTYWNVALGAYSAPAVMNAVFNSSDRPHSFDLTFSQDVGASIATGDFVIGGNRYNFANGQNVPVTFVAGVDFHLDSYNPVTRTARIVFDMVNEMGISQIIPSGRYSVAFAAGSVTNTVGSSVDAAYSFQIALLTGDTNGDLIVNFDDLLKVAQGYGSSVSSNPFFSGDFNDDGVVNFDDLLVLAQHYGVSI